MMEPPFARELERKITKFMGDKHPDFFRRELNAKQGREWLLFRWEPADDLKCGVGVRFVKGRNYVIPKVMWSKAGKLSLDEPDFEVLDQPIEDLADFNKFEWLTLSACEFGRIEDVFEMEHKKPDAEFLKQKLDNDQARHILEEQGFGDWREDPAVPIWGVLIEIFGEEFLTNEDITHALGSLPNQIQRLIDEDFVPYLRMVWQSKGSAG